MSQYFDMIIPFVLGGGITSLISIKYARRTAKVDFAKKSIDFMQNVNELMSKHYDELKKDYDDLAEKVEELRTASCINFTCKDRRRAV